MGTVTKWRETETEEAAARLDFTSNVLVTTGFLTSSSQKRRERVMAAKTSNTSFSPFSPTASDKVDTSSFSAPTRKIDTSMSSSMDRRTSSSHFFSPKATTEQVYQHLGLAWPPIRKLRLSEGSALAKARLSGVNFEPSPSQPVTPGQGNSCMFHALLDQLKFQQGSSLASLAASHSQLRSKLVQASYNSVKAGKLTWPEGESVEEWRSGMVQEGTMGDQVILQAAANLFQRQIVILPVFWSAAHLPSLGITLISPSSKTTSSPNKTITSSSALFLQYYSESRFLTPHYQSVRPKPGQNHLVDTLHQWLIDEEGGKKPKEEEDDFIMQLNELPDPPCTPVRNLRSSFFTPSPYNSFILPSSSPPPSSVSPSPSSSPSTSSPPSSPSLSNSSSSSEFMHLLERE